MDIERVKIALNAAAQELTDVCVNVFDGEVGFILAFVTRTEDDDAHSVRVLNASNLPPEMAKDVLTQYGAALDTGTIIYSSDNNKKPH